MKYSIRKQMMAVFIGLIVCMLVFLFAVNAWFLEPYYIRNKKAEFVRMYQLLQETMQSEDMDDEEAADRIVRRAENHNLSYVVLNLTGKVLYTNIYNNSLMGQQLMGYLLGQREPQSRVLEKTDSYEISRTKDRVNQSEYLVMWGELGDNSFFLIRSPVESMEESAQLSNRFLLLVGSMMIVVCVALVWFFSRKLTEPILELASLSARMADLDFNAKYTSGGKNEIGVLGDHFNVMSEKLEKAISEMKNANYHLQKDIELKEKQAQMRSEFLGNVSHELKTPIALIQGYAEGLKEGVSEDAQSREFYCDVIMDEAAKMNELVKNLMTLNQMEVGDEEVEFTRFNLTELVCGVLQSMEILRQQKEARVILSQKEPVYVWADEFKVEQVVLNYVSNAFHHLEGERVIDVKIQADDEKARVSVFNTGQPIPEEDIDQIWEKFYKVDKAHTREYGGNGIGLSIVKAIMDSFHQRYGVKNYENGVEFWFELDVK